MVSPTQWTWVWASSKRWWRTRKPGLLKSVRSQRVRHNLVIKQQQGMATHSSTFACRTHIERGAWQATGFRVHRVRHNWSDGAHAHACTAPSHFPASSQHFLLASTSAASWLPLDCSLPYFFLLLIPTHPSVFRSDSSNMISYTHSHTLAVTRGWVPLLDFVSATHQCEFWQFSLCIAIVYISFFSRFFTSFSPDSLFPY